MPLIILQKKKKKKTVFKSKGDYFLTHLLIQFCLETHGIAGVVIQNLCNCIVKTFQKILSKLTS